MYAKLEKCPFFLNRVVGACGVFLNNQLIYEVHSSPGARGAGVPAVGLDSLSKRTLLKLKGLSDSSVDKVKASMMSRVLVEAFTYNNGYYGRFLILVKLGIGCTVWYGFAYMPWFDASLAAVGKSWNRSF